MSGADRDLVIERLTKRFATFTAVDDLSVTVPQGSFFALLGPSGCGKTTTLRMVAGLEHPTSGAIRLGDTDISALRPYQRPVNTVFQSYALFPHLTIFENVAFGLRRRGHRNVKGEVAAMLELVELGQYAGRKPAQLSGGQQQRVAVARALINKPEVLLLDEPLGALDLKLRRGMQLELKRIQTEVGITFVHVTHDQEEAMTMADTIAVMNGGVIEQLGSPVDIYEHPATTFAANFLGQSNLVAGTVTGAHDASLDLDVHGTRLAATEVSSTVRSGSAWVGVRPEKVTLVKPGAAPLGSNVLTGGTVTDASYVGVSIQYLVRMPWGQEITVFTQNNGAQVPFEVGDQADASWRPEHTFVLDARQDATAGADPEGDG